MSISPVSESRSIDAHQLDGERIGEWAILVSLLRHPQRVAIALERIRDEHAGTHHGRVLRDDWPHRDEIVAAELIGASFRDEWPPGRAQLVGRRFCRIRERGPWLFR